MLAVTGIVAVFTPATNGRDLLVSIGEKAADSSLIWQPLWQAFEVEQILNNPPAVAFDGDSTLYCFYPSTAQDTQYLFYNTFNGTSWSGQTMLSVAETATGPGATTFNNQVYVFWQGCKATMTGLSPSEELFYCVIGQNYCWQIDSGAIMSNCPSAVGFNDSLYVFYQGPGQNGTLCYSQSSGGADAAWGSSTQVPSTCMSSSPGAVVFTSPSTGQPELYVFHQGGQSNGQLWYNVLDTAGSWAGDKQVPKASMSAGPGATVVDGTLYVFYEGGGSNGTLWYVSSSDGSNWAVPLQVAPVQCSGTPSLVMLGSQLYCLMQGPGNDGELWYLPLTLGEACGWMTKANGLTLSQSPAAVNFQGQLWCFTANGDGALGYTFNDGSGFPPIAYVNYGATGYPAAVVFDELLYIFYNSGSNLSYRTLAFYENDVTVPQYVTVDGTTIPVPTTVVSTNADGTTSTTSFADDVHYRYDWSGPFQVSGVGLSASPFAVVFNQELYVFHLGSASGLYYSVLDSSGNWAPDAPIGLGSVDCGASPAAVVFNQELYVFYVSNAGLIYFSKLSNGSWGSPVQVSSGIFTTQAVALISYDDGSGAQLYCVYQNQSSGYIWYISSSSPGGASSWSAPVQIGNTRSSSPPGAISELADLAISCLQMF
jgi:hypothetical protein